MCACPTAKALWLYTNRAPALLAASREVLVSVGECGRDEGDSERERE